ncbi:MAG: NAD-dependent epimerase/dehydratase family protein [Bacillota bacterium]
MISITGAAGFTGQRVVRRLINRGLEVRAVVHRNEQRALFPDCGTLAGDVYNADFCRGAVRGADVVISMAHPLTSPNVATACVIERIPRAVFVTTTGAFSKYRSAAAGYLAAEDAIRASGVPYTILRPTMIYGGPGDRNMHRLVRVLAKTPVFPVFGDGSHLMQPIHVDDLADIIVAAALDDSVVGQEFNVAGANALPYKELVRTVAAALGRRVLILHTPLGLAAAIAGAFEQAHLPFPVKREQVLRLAEDKAFDTTEARRRLGFRPRTFEEGIVQEVAAVRNPQLEATP